MTVFDGASADWRFGTARQVTSCRSTFNRWQLAWNGSVQVASTTAVFIANLGARVVDSVVGALVGINSTHWGTPTTWKATSERSTLGAMTELWSMLVIDRSARIDSTHWEIAATWKATSERSTFGAMTTVQAWRAWKLALNQVGAD